MVKMLKSSFSFGFELEAIAASGTSNLEERFNDFLGDFGDMHRDGSLRPGRDRGGIPFEYSSPVFQYTPANISKVIKFLSNLKDWDVYTNRSCGFHTHISFNGITKKDVMWFMLYLCGTGKIHEFDKLGRTLLYNRTYASPRFLERVESYLKNMNLVDALTVVATNEKYRSIRLHPQGTVEWRGPRTFLNTPSRKKTKTFFEKLDKMINYFVESVNAKSFEVQGYTSTYSLTREMFENACIKCRNYYSTNFKKNTSGRTLFEICSNTPEILEKIPYKGLVKAKEQLMDILQNNGSVGYYKGYKSKALLKFVVENWEENSLVNKICCMFDSDTVIANADLLYSKSKLYEYFTKNIGDNIKFIDYMIELANKGLYKNTLKKVVKVVSEKASSAYFVSFMATLIDNGFLSIYDDENEKNELINKIVSNFSSTSPSYFFNSFSPAYIAIHMAKKALNNHGIKV